MLFERYCNGNIRSMFISILFPVAHAHMNCCFANNHTQGNSFNGKPFFFACSVFSWQNFICIFEVSSDGKMGRLQVITEAALLRCSYKNVFWKFVANLQENTHAKVWFQCWNRTSAWLSLFVITDVLCKLNSFGPPKKCLLRF